MNIVFLDAFTANPGDISWEELTNLGNFIKYDRTDERDVLARIKDADIAITNKVFITDEIINKCDNLKYICVAATGYNIVDIKAARAKNIPVSNVSGYSTKSVAQITFGHILNLTLKIETQSNQVKEGRWTKSVDFTYNDNQIFELSDMTIGLAGFGNIARSVAKIANGFDMNIITFKPGEIINKPDYVTQVSKEDFFRKSDIISLHCPLNSETKEMINKDTISLIKKTAYIINTGRGGLINEKDLAGALNTGRIAGAGIDVLCEEPPKSGSPLIYAKNCKITPHIAWTSVEARRKLIKGLTENITAFLSGNPINVVN